MQKKNSEKSKLIVAISPHIKDRKTTTRIMYGVIIALIPALAGAIYFFGLRSLYLVIIASVSAMLVEWLCKAVRKKPLTFDGSAILTGMLLAFNLPVQVPYWVPAVGSIFAILVVKEAFGGLGYNILNPALAGRAFLMASWPSMMTGRWSAPIRPIGSTIHGISATTSATPLSMLKLHPGFAQELNSWATIRHLLFGNVGGSLGETSAILLLVGAIFLFAMKYIDYRIPFSYIGTVFALTGILHVVGVTPGTPLFHILAGGLFLGAFFMATDYVTTPVTPKGSWIFGIGCGIITVIIRIWGGYPEGVCYSVLLMNSATPLIDRITRPRRFGELIK
ncbi:MAG TPA: RnfABCDGE type electron transport complex subunit D [bacterium (Candidatus Stahlbacteria)]|nr:RnfABCDGE type electron transport complex subunit D [Candidatus Stahlbacteria bacterium]